jgi:hypothetical protein
MKTRLSLTFMIAIIMTLCSCAGGGQGKVTQARKAQVTQNWHALKEGMTYEEVDKLIGPLSKMQFFGDVHFDMGGKADYANIHFKDSTCELVFKGKMKHEMKQMAVVNKRLISWTRQ